MSVRPSTAPSGLAVGVTTAAAIILIVGGICHAMEGFVGIATNVRHRGLSTRARPEMFLPFDQRPGPSMHLVVSSASSDPASLAGAVRREVYALRPGQAVSSVQTMEQIVAADTCRP